MIVTHLWHWRSCCAEVNLSNKQTVGGVSAGNPSLLWPRAAVRFLRTGFAAPSPPANGSEERWKPPPPSWVHGESRSPRAFGTLLRKHVQSYSILPVYYRSRPPPDQYFRSPATGSSSTSGSKPLANSNADLHAPQDCSVPLSIIEPNLVLSWQFRL